MHKLSVSNPKSKDFQRLDFQSRLEHTISESEPCCYTQKMKLISSTILFASLAMSANANDFPATNFGPGCLNFQNDGSWSQVPDFGNGAFLVNPESPFRFSTDTRFPDQAVLVGPAVGELTAADNDWTLDIFDTMSQNSGSTHDEAWYKNNNHGKFAATWHSKSANDSNKHNTFQIVISEVIGGDMGEGNNICFCYGDMQWGPGNVHVESSGSSDHTHIDFAGGTYNNVAALKHKTCCFHADKLKELGSNNADFASLCHTRGTEAAANGDPHFKTWQNEHFEYHGQCDLVLTKNPDFANGLGIDVHIRTKVIRHWSYIKNAVIRIGNDILEIEGSAVESDPETHYWINYESQGELTEFAGFPVKMFSQQGTAVTKNRIEIDLDSVYPGQKIVLSTYKEFVKVSFENASEESFGKSVGMLGDFNTGKTLARDSVTVLNDFTELGHEWQVLPSDKHLFREVSAPQFPDRCIDPEDPRGERRRRRRLDGSSVSEEEAEAACAGLQDELDRKDCVYDILATQDLDMAGAY
mmetsp:Transcript_17337/g.42401  ORF Transcript_17337/g.42401 Transcript_17337/m.42401 type:complete len:526 (+) Transcript_17337:281-1858(+)